MLIAVNLVAVALESMPEIAARYALLFDVIEYVSLVVFTIEYGLRLWVAVEHAPFRHGSPFMGRDLRAEWRRHRGSLAVMPFWFAFVLPPDLRVLLVLRMIRFLRSRAIRRP